ncbi:hypothetical protein [Pontiella agarivorans]|uniref:Uncharacterized protein n=1 Tax=Pontiella agarivorans TaxID=3038953 RepID=A0ABU5N070_9BACT|nr:hypothetical protein [Pontiella agarivorans]MDZ8119835.1 hypothetical protein [Pontiella agarivorans]
MKSNTPYILIGIASFAALISIGAAMTLAAKHKAVKAENFKLKTQIAQMEATLPDVSKEPEIIYLTHNGDTNDITALKSQLAEKEALLQAFQSNTNRPEQRDRNNRQSFEERMAQMKEEDPQGYAEMIKRREERSSQMRYNLAERTATFMDINTSSMTEEELANHEQLIAQMAQIWEMTELFQDPEAAPDRETMREMMEVARDTRPLLETEREVMLKQLGADLGYEGEDAEAFALYIGEIYEATTLNMPGGRGRGSSRGR